MVTVSKTEHIIDLTTSHVMNTYGRLPLALVKGEGSRVWDADGKQYLDFVSGIAVNNLGHRHPRVVEAMRQAADTLIHCSNLYHIESQGLLAKRLAELSGLDRAFFCNSGAEANEAAIKLARRYVKKHVDPNRYEIITAINSFHGRTLATVTATGQPKYHAGFEPLPAGFTYVPLNDVAALRQAVTEKTCAIMLEPVQGEGGVRPCTDEYMNAARELCDEHGLLLIFDEVQTGLGRTGKMFGFEHFSIRPDIITLAKALGGGVPIGAMLSTEKAAQGFEPGSHASTFGGNPFATAVANAVLQVLTEEDLPERAAQMGDVLRKRLEKLAQKYPTLLGEVRGKGLLIGVALKDGGSAILHEALERGLFINVVGSSVLRLLPPLNVTEQEIDEAIEILDESIAAVVQP